MATYNVRGCRTRAGRPTTTARDGEVARMATRRQRAGGLVQALGALLLLGGCSGNGAPVIGELLDQRAAVNVELGLTLTASDPEGDPLTFTFDSDLPNIQARARIEPGDAGEAFFLWTPLVSDVGAQPFTFTVSDGEQTDTTTLTIEIATAEGSTAPLFVQPLGTGSTLDLNQQACIDVPLVVTDPDSPSVTLGQEEPLIAGATIDQTDALEGTWSFCPTKEQIAADDRYGLLLSADDGDNPATLKDYLIVLRGDGGQGCPGEPPVVAHDAQDAETVDDIPIIAQVTDELGMKYEPLLYYSTTPPDNPPNVTEMTQLSMTLVDGDDEDGTWSVAIPNPVAGEPAGSSAQLYYVIAATDNDDPMGTCDHTTQVPETGSFTITVTNPGGSGDTMTCDVCSADAQCASAGAMCVVFDGDYRCMNGCSADADCPSGTYCSFGNFHSIDGDFGKICVPTSMVCQAQPPPPTGCQDDGFEDNDSLSQAQSAAPLPSGSHNAVSCPGDNSNDDEDFYRIEVGSEGTLDVTLSGGSASDLDLVLYDAVGATIDQSQSLTSNESVTTCLASGTYFVRVHAYGPPADNPYTLSWSLTSGSCGQICTDDGNEPDDDALGARAVDLNLGTFTSLDQQICSENEDWFSVQMYAGETLHSKLTFLQSTPSEDLDIWLFDDNGVNLTGCDEANPGLCDPFNGQSGTSGEILAWPIAQTGTYYVVVHGWSGSANGYDICIDYDTPCP